MEARITEIDQPRQPAGWQPFEARKCPIWRAWIKGTAGVLTLPALIDTGASHTCATRRLLERIGAVPTGAARHFVGAYGEDQNSGAFLADLRVPFTGIADWLDLREFTLYETVLEWGGMAPRYELILGCDVLRRCTFTMVGPLGVFQLDRFA